MLANISVGTVLAVTVVGAESLLLLWLVGRVQKLRHHDEVVQRRNVVVQFEQVGQHE